MIVHVVSHTHWDREWYHTAERFRQRLVPLIDELLDDRETPGSFLLDGQAVVLEDYLDVRPERAAELGAALRDGRLEAGPWFVLADELIPGGEGLVRNLLAGAHALRALRAESPPVLYCPDSFGHPAALPTLAQGFRKVAIVVWRGRRGSGDTFWWTHSGTRVATYHLSPSGYELGASLPRDASKARERGARIRAELTPRSTTGLSLLLNGADHHARQHELRGALGALSAAAAPDDVRAGSLADFGRELARRAASPDVPEFSGELRDSYGYTWTLQGTLASRAAQKRRYAQVERDLLRDVEPWAALARLRGGRSRQHLTRVAWRPLLLCQPHDSLCGCSIDAVARAVAVRLDSAESQAVGLRQDALCEIMGHDVEAARSASSNWTPTLLIRNRAARARSGVALIETTAKLADVPVGPGSGATSRRTVARPRAGRVLGQILSQVVDYERTESARAYPDNDAVLRTRAIAWVGDVPPLGVRPLSLAAKPGDETSDLVPAVTVAGKRISNGLLTLRWDSRGSVRLDEPHSRRTLAPLLTWESREDRGDLYTPSIRGNAGKARHVRSRVAHRGPLRGTLEQQWELRRGRERIDLTVRYSLDAAARFVRVEIAGVNGASDHRLRACFRTDVKGDATVADAAFGPLDRVPPRVSPRDAKMEKPVFTAPLHRYVSCYDRVRGVTLFSDGLAEYETLENAFAVTLVRAVGELSRNDLRERPGHAGWPASTPDAQSRGPFAASFAILLHGPRSDAVSDEIERAADDVLLPLVGETLRSALRVPDPVRGFELEGAGLSFSTAKESGDGEWVVLRCVNVLDRETSGAWRLEPVREARLSQLDEAPGEVIPVRDGRVGFTAPARGVVTILVR